MMKTYLVGGAVRDKLLGYPYCEHDWVVTGSSPEEMKDLGFTPVGKDFPVFLHPHTKEEYALARTERKSAPGYSGFVFHTAPEITLEEDLQRRDLTINAIAEDESGKLIDPYNGTKDIELKLLRHVSNAFTEDPVRILRVARFAARYHHLGFRVATETLQLMTQMTEQGEVDHLVPERVWKEWQRALGERSPQEFIQTLQLCQALDVIVPELSQRLELNHAPLERLHTALPLSDCERIRLGVLLFDLDTENSDTCCQLITQLCTRLGTPKAERELLIKVALHHSSAFKFQQLNSTEQLQLLSQLDAFRRPQLLEEFSLCCHIIARQQSIEFDHHGLIQALELCNSVQTKDIIASGITGKAIGAAITTQRIALLSEQLKQHATTPPSPTDQP